MSEIKTADLELITTKIVPLLRVVKGGTKLPVMVAVAGSKVAVFLSRLAISTSRRKLLTEYLDAGSPKVFMGDCVFEDGSYTFVLKAQAGGLAKKIKAGLQEQTGLKLKVRVRGESDEVDDDGDEPEEKQKSSIKPIKVADKAKPGSGKPAEKEDPQKVAYELLMKKLSTKMAAAIKSSPDGAKIRAIAEIAAAKAKKGDYKTALKAIEGVQKAL